jgi:hypothetical protein
VPPVASVSAPQPPTLLCRLGADGAFELTLIGQPSQRCQIETSPDLVNWSPAQTITLFDGTALIRQPRDAHQQFYRARVLP